ncbi:terminase [Zunongwangia sp. SCSIO 43204]|uniref:phage terminase large subunit n=1 Tax=Zunongwangia sp. SCSIO 43204 TaxID=2779359 RepID=UPI001CA8FAB6|nr:phage terminase large subunit [Zunongwangia sp. SCSIO 43204]UAB85697.1 terminase [Zunongwangia sp. SCSIO 43204]
MPQETIDIPVLKHQIAFIESNATHTGLVGGFGSGKSKAGTLKTIEKKKQYPGINVAYYLPTYGLIKDIAFPNFKEMLDLMEIPYELNETDKEFKTPLGKIILRSMENPDKIVGYEVGYSLIDEADILPKGKMRNVMVKIAGRNRKPLPDGLPNSIDMVSTPEGFKFLYEFFVKESKPNRVLIKAKTKDNPYLPSSYIETLSDIYSAQELEAYLNGEFVNLSAGTVYHAFDRKVNHTDRTVKAGDKLHVGMDFNITNMSATIRVTDGKIFSAVDEVTGAYDTADMIGILKERYPKHKIIVYPDASGNARNTAGDSDIKLLKKAKFKVITGAKNPSVRDRITTVNGSFKNANGETINYINTYNCPDLTEAYEQLPYKNGVPDKDSGFDHITDADGYVIYGLKHKSGTIRIRA